MSPSTTTIDVEHFLTPEARDLGPRRVHLRGEVIEEVRPLAGARPDEPGPEGAVALMPLLADAHAHLGISDGVDESPAFHTAERVEQELSAYLRCGVGHVLSLGTDQPWLQELAEERQRAGGGGAAVPYSAGCGFGARDGWPPELTLPELRFRPIDMATAQSQVRELARRGVRIVKLWVDDLGGTVPKLDPEVATALIGEAHALGLRTSAHVYSLKDAERLVAAGVDALAHSVRDVPMTPELAEAIAARGTRLIPTLVREENALMFAGPANAYLDDDLFVRCAGDRIGRLRGLWRERADEGPDPGPPCHSLDLACRNLLACARAGVPICMGTDAGFRLKLPGFSQVRELELMSKAGLPAAAVLRSALERNYEFFASSASRLRPGDSADFLLVRGNPLDSVSALREVVSVWQRGKPVPLTTS
jgi:hypothetical protein